ncbi:MAG: hypothetical protein CMG76_02665, partial [Candidatus Marinimicrobia bacterium]|nr:hypothetical protein [Candidatus Neomarinimicrobiota bacterium]
MSIGWGQDCDENMYWTDCGLPFECNPTCSNPNPLPGCMTMCEIGCFCNEGYIFSDDLFNECILIENCPQPLCNEETEVELWGECYNIEETTFINFSYQEGSDYPPLTGEIPSEIGQLVNLTDLYLGGNDLILIPPEIGNLVNLQSLFLYDNQFTSIPSEIGNLTNLRTLDIGYNQITGLPNELFSLSNLILLRLEHNELTSISNDICNLSGCDVFISDNYICPPYPQCLSINNIGLQNTYGCTMYLLGDINFDNNINIYDLIIGVQIILGNVDPPI